MELFWALYWIAAVVSLPGTVMWFIHTAFDGKVKNVDGADWVLIVIAAITCSPFWMLPAGYWGYRAVRSVPSLYPNARRQRKAELMERRRKEKFQAGLKAMREIEREGRRELERKQRKNVMEHRDWDREFNPPPPKPAPMREVNTIKSGIAMSRELDRALRDAERAVNAILDKRNRGKQVYEREVEAAEAAVDRAEALRFANEQRMGRAKEDAKWRQPPQKKIPVRVGNEEGWDDIVVEDSDGEISNWNQLHPSLKELLVSTDNVRLITGGRVRLDRTERLVYNKSKLKNLGIYPL